MKMQSTIRAPITVQELSVEQWTHILLTPYESHTVDVPKAVQ